MTKRSLNEQVTSDLRNHLASLLANEPHLSPEEAMTKASCELLQNNPFVPPDGDKCPINRLPDELLSQIFEAGMCIEREEQQLGDDDDVDDDDYYEETDESDGDDNEVESSEEIGENESEIIVTQDGDDDDDWSDIDDEPKTRKEKRKERNSDEEMEESDNEDEESVLPFQILVSHVCRRWRAIALDTPSLWTLLEFAKGTPLDKHKAYIDRAKTAPVDILIDCTFEDAFEEEPDLQALENKNRDRELIECLTNSIDRSDPSLPDFFSDSNWHRQPSLDGPLPEHELLDDHYYTITEFSEILDMIIPHLPHWRALAVSVSDYRWIYLLLARLHQCGPAECLEIFELYHYDNDDDGDFFQPRELAAKFTPFHGQAPLLQDCAFWGVHLDWDTSLGMFRGLQDLELAYHTEEVRPSFSTFAAILDSSPEIRILTLCLSGPRAIENDWREAGAAPIQIPSLQSLVLRYHSPQYACSLLRFLDTPNVHSLALDFDEQDYTDFAKELCKTAHRRSKSLLAGLQNLKISGLPCSRALVDKILEQLVNLKSLNLNCSGEEEAFFEALRKASGVGVGAPDSGSAASSGQVCCPVLESITTAGITGKQMKEFIETRSRAGVPVKRVFMSEQDEVDLVSERWLKGHLKEFEYFEPSDSEEEIIDIEEDFDSD